MVELQGIPEEWLANLTNGERERINLEENERLDRMLAEEGFDAGDNDVQR